MVLPFDHLAGHPRGISIRLSHGGQSCRKEQEMAGVTVGIDGSPNGQVALKLILYRLACDFAQYPSAAAAVRAVPSPEVVR
jgi:hypothetical protein